MAYQSWYVPLIIRGEIVDDAGIHFGGRRGDIEFSTPDVSRYIDQLTLRRPSQLADLYELTFDDIVEYLDGLGKRLDIRNNVFLQEPANTLTYL